MSKYNVEKLALGTYRPKRDGPLETELPGEIISNIEVPETITSPAVKKYWDMIVTPICSLGVIKRQDYLDFKHAFELLQRLEQTRTLMDKLDNKSLLSKNLDKWLALSKQEQRLIEQFTKVMHEYFVSPKQRLKALSLTKGSEEKNDDGFDD